MAKVAINGLGRIGRAALKIITETPELDLVAVNDLIPTENLVYLLKYDTVYGRYHKKVTHSEEGIQIEGNTYKVFNEKDPAKLPWEDLGVDLVFECTGVFRKKEGMEKHLQAGAKMVVLSAPAKSDDIPMVVHGVNTPETRVDLLSTASCTTNCIAPVYEVMGRRIGVEKAIMTTIHAYTSSQTIVDGPRTKVRRGRAGAANFVPTTTGAAKATTQVLPQYEGTFDGVAVRGPIPVGSITDIVFVTKRDTSVDEVNTIFQEEADSDRYRGILGVTDDMIVSSDIIQDDRASVVDLTMTKVIGGNLVKVMSWYDNEWGYASQMIREGVRMVKAG